MIVVIVVVVVTVIVSTIDFARKRKNTHAYDGIRASTIPPVVSRHIFHGDFILTWYREIPNPGFAEIFQAG